MGHVRVRVCTDFHCIACRTYSPMSVGAAEDNDDGNYAVMITDANDARIDAAALGLRPDISDNDPLEPIFKFAPNCATYKVQRTCTAQMSTDTRWWWWRKSFARTCLSD